MNLKKSLNILKMEKMRTPTIMIAKIVLNRNRRLVTNFREISPVFVVKITWNRSRQIEITRTKLWRRSWHWTTQLFGGSLGAKLCEILLVTRTFFGLYSRQNSTASLQRLSWQTFSQIFVKSLDSRQNRRLWRPLRAMKYFVKSI